MATRAKPVVVSLAQCALRRASIERRDHFAVRADALVDFDYALIQQLRQHDVAIEQARAVLICDAQRVAKAARGDERVRFALAFEQRVGRDRRAHLHRFDRARVIASPACNPSRWRMPATAASRYCSGFSDSSLCVVRLPSGSARDDVGEGAAAVDPELPAGRRANIGAMIVLHGVEVFDAKKVAGCEGTFQADSSSRPRVSGNVSAAIISTPYAVTANIPMLVPRPNRLDSVPISTGNSAPIARPTL